MQSLESFSTAVRSAVYAAHTLISTVGMPFVWKPPYACAVAKHLRAELIEAAKGMDDWLPKLLAIYPEAPPVIGGCSGGSYHDIAFQIALNIYSLALGWADPESSRGTVDIILGHEPPFNAERFQAGFKTLTQMLNYPGIAPERFDCARLGTMINDEAARCLLRLNAAGTAPEASVPASSTAALPSPELPPVTPPAAKRLEAHSGRPLQMLNSWGEILETLEQRGKRETVRRLNEQFNGPIITGDRGKQPSVDKAKLIEWWNGLESRQTELAARRRDAQAASAAPQYEFGRDGLVAPEIGGSVKKRRGRHTET